MGCLFDTTKKRKVKNMKIMNKSIIKKISTTLLSATVALSVGVASVIITSATHKQLESNDWVVAQSGGTPTISAETVEEGIKFNFAEESFPGGANKLTDVMTTSNTVKFDGLSIKLKDYDKGANSGKYICLALGNKLTGASSDGGGIIIDMRNNGPIHYSNKDNTGSVMGSGQIGNILDSGNNLYGNNIGFQFQSWKNADGTFTMKYGTDSNKSKILTAQQVEALFGSADPEIYVNIMRGWKPVAGTYAAESVVLSEFSCGNTNMFTNCTSSSRNMLLATQNGDLSNITFTKWGGNVANSVLAKPIAFDGLSINDVAFNQTHYLRLSTSSSGVLKDFGYTPISDQNGIIIKVNKSDNKVYADFSDSYPSTEIGALTAGATKYSIKIVKTVDNAKWALRITDDKNGSFDYILDKTVLTTQLGAVPESASVYVAIAAGDENNAPLSTETFTIASVVNVDGTVTDIGGSADDEQKPNSESWAPVEAENATVTALDDENGTKITFSAIDNRPGNNLATDMISTKESVKLDGLHLLLKDRTPVTGKSASLALAIGSKKFQADNVLDGSPANVLFCMKSDGAGVVYFTDQGGQSYNVQNDDEKSVQIGGFIDSEANYGGEGGFYLQAWKQEDGTFKIKYGSSQNYPEVTLSKTQLKALFGSEDPEVYISMQRDWRPGAGKWNEMSFNVTEFSNNSNMFKDCTGESGNAIYYSQESTLKGIKFLHFGGHGATSTMVKPIHFDGLVIKDIEATEKTMFRIANVKEGTLGHINGYVGEEGKAGFIIAVEDDRKVYASFSDAIPGEEDEDYIGSLTEGYTKYSISILKNADGSLWVARVTDDKGGKLDFFLPKESLKWSFGCEPADATVYVGYTGGLNGKSDSLRTVKIAEISNSDNSVVTDIVKPSDKKDDNTGGKDNPSDDNTNTGSDDGDWEYKYEYYYEDVPSDTIPATGNESVVIPVALIAVFSLAVLVIRKKIKAK